MANARGYHGPPPETIGYLPPRKPGQHPALMAASGGADEPEPGRYVIRDDAVRAVHLTLIHPDGSGTAETHPDKFMIGPVSGAPICISPPNDLLGLVVTESVEEALGAYQATGLGCWAAGSAGLMPELAAAIPACIETVTIAMHGNEAGRRSAPALADALTARTARGIEVHLLGARS